MATPIICNQCGRVLKATAELADPEKLCSRCRMARQAQDDGDFPQLPSLALNIRALGRPEKKEPAPAPPVTPAMPTLKPKSSSPFGSTPVLRPVLSNTPTVEAPRMAQPTPIGRRPVQQVDDPSEAPEMPPLLNLSAKAPEAPQLIVLSPKAPAAPEAPQLLNLSAKAPAARPPQPRVIAAPPPAEASPPPAQAPAQRRQAEAAKNKPNLRLKKDAEVEHLVVPFFVRFVKKTLFTRKEREEGPFSFDELVCLYINGDIGPETELRREDEAQWFPAEQVKELFTPGNMSARERKKKGLG